MPSFSTLAIYILAALAATSSAAPIDTTLLTDVAHKVDAKVSVNSRGVELPEVELPKANIAAALDERQLDLLNKVIPADELLEKVAPVTDLVHGVTKTVVDALPLRVRDDACTPCKAGSIVSDVLNKVSPLLEKIESLKVSDITEETLDPILKEATDILSGATSTIKGLVGTVEGTVGEVSIDDLAKEIAPLLNTVFGALGGVLNLVKGADHVEKKVTDLLDGVASPLGDFVHSITDLVGGELSSAVLPLVSSTIGPVISELGCLTNFEFLGINVGQLAGKVVGSVTGLL